MMNRVEMIGRITKDIEVRKTQTGLSVARFTVACNRPVQKGKNQEADFIGCIAWRQTADFLGNYAKKGALVSVEGSIRTSSYDRQDGTKQFVTEVLCDRVNLLESKGKSSGNGQQQTTTLPEDNGQEGTLDISNDDLPF